MGSMCSKEPVVTANNKNALSKHSKVQDIKKIYEYVCALGNGSFGKIRLYRDRKCKDLKYAIKTVKKDGLTTDVKESILEEVDILRNLDHPNIVKYYDTYEDDLYLNIVMEYLAGPNLFEVIALKKIHSYSEKDAQEITKCILKALVFIHKKKIVHRDLKPENLIFGIPGDYQSLKIIDFNLSTYFVKQRRKMNKTAGSPLYMAPELILGTYTFKTDMWSVGIILYVLLTGVHPFTAEDLEKLFYQIAEGKWNMMVLGRSHCSNEAKDLVEKLLVVSEKERLSADEALQHPWFKLNQIDVDKTPRLESQIIDSIKKFSQTNSLQREIYFYLARISEEDEVSKLKEIFNKLDTNNTGTLSYEEIIEGFKQAGLSIEKVQNY
jgi:calcium-dependent protein kinase